MGKNNSQGGILKFAFKPALITRAVYRDGLDTTSIAVLTFIQAESSVSGQYTKGNAIICNLLKLSERSVSYTLKKLKARGWISVHRRSNKNSLIRVLDARNEVWERMVKEEPERKQRQVVPQPIADNVLQYVKGSGSATHCG